MARRRSRKAARIEPMELDYYFNLTEYSGAVGYIDLAQVASLVNRKFIRQQQQFVVSQVELVTNGNATVKISRLPNTWVCVNALEKAFHTWRESQEQVLDEEPSIKPRYSDFKVYMNAHHANQTVALNMLPTTGQVDPTTGTDDQYIIAAAGADYDWEISDIQMPNYAGTPGNTQEFNLHVLGDDLVGPVFSWGIIKGYAESRSRPQQQDPNVVQGVTSWMTMTMDVGENLPEIRTDLSYNNDNPPYLIGMDQPEEYYPGGSLQAFGPTLECQLQAISTVPRSVGSSYSDSFVCNAGLLQVNWDSEGESLLKITLAPGPMKGVMSRDIKEVN